MNSGQDRCWHALFCCILLYSIIAKTPCHVSVPSWNAHILSLLLPKYSKANSFKLNHDFGHHIFYEFLPCHKRLLWCAHDFSQSSSQSYLEMLRIFHSLGNCSFILKAALRLSSVFSTVPQPFKLALWNMCRSALSVTVGRNLAWKRLFSSLMISLISFALLNRVPISQLHLGRDTTSM